jgi:hypothetical protein
LPKMRPSGLVMPSTAATEPLGLKDRKSTRLNSSH